VIEELDILISVKLHQGKAFGLSVPNYLAFGNWK